MIGPKDMTDSLSHEQFTPLKPTPMVRIRIATDYQASSKRIEPSVTVEIICPGDGFVDDEALAVIVDDVRRTAYINFKTILAQAEEAIAAIRPGGAA